MDRKLCDVEFFEMGPHSAQVEIDQLAARPRAKAFAIITELRASDRGLLRNLKKTKQRELWEYKARTPEGGLRVLFAYGRHGRVWCLGAFVKRNDAEGNRLLKSRYAKLAVAASGR